MPKQHATQYLVEQVAWEVYDNLFGATPAGPVIAYWNRSFYLWDDDADEFQRVLNIRIREQIRAYVAEHYPDSGRRLPNKVFDRLAELVPNDRHPNGGTMSTPLRINPVVKGWPNSLRKKTRNRR